MTDSPRMSKGERDELAKLVRRREHVAKTATAQRAAELLADFEQQMAARYSYDDDAVWKAATEAAQRQIQEADEVIAARCEELGIPREFRPSLHIDWYGRGQNALAGRRAELRKVAQTRLAALEKAAKAEIERASVEVQTQLVAGGLESEAARAFLASMPTVEALMPPLAVAELEAATTHQPKRGWRLLQSATV